MNFIKGQLKHRPFRFYSFGFTFLLWLLFLIMAFFSDGDAPIHGPRKGQEHEVYNFNHDGTNVHGPCTDLEAPNAPSIGKLNIPTFIISFADTERDPDIMSKRAIKDLLFNVSNKKSLSYWMYRSSYGQLEVDGSVYFYKAKKKMRDYEGVEAYDYEPLAEEVMEAFDDEIDFSDFDSDDDGYIDAMIFNIIGADDYFYGSQNSWYDDPDFSIDGVQPGKYIIDDAQPLNSESDREYYVQVAAHEMGHCMGLRDLYKVGEDEDFDAMNGIAGSEMMDEMEGDYSQFSKLMLGWLTDDEVQICREDGEYTIPSSSFSGGCILIPRDTDMKDSETITSEYFLIQYDTANGNMESVLTPKTSGVRILHCDATIDTDVYGERIFRYDVQSPTYDETHNSQRLVRLVNDGEGYMRRGDTADSSTPGFAWYDDFGKETIDPGITVTVESINSEEAVISIAHSKENKKKSEDSIFDAFFNGELSKHDFFIKPGLL